MQYYLKIEISDLDGYAPKYIHELSKGLVLCLSQIGQGNQGHARRPTSGVLCTESFNKGVKAVYRPRWESTVPSQCCPLEGRREDTT